MLIPLCALALQLPFFCHAQQAPIENPAPAQSSPPVEKTPPAVLLVRHIPPMSAPADQPLVISANVDASHLAHEIVLYVRAVGATRYERILFRRESTDAVRFSAVIPAERMTPGAIEYYIASRGISDGARAPEHLHFASPEAPHPVVARGNDEARWRRALLAEHLGNRSRFAARVEYANFGNRTRAGSPDPVSDFYVRGEFDYTYRLLGWAYSIRLGGGLLLGETYITQNGTLLQIPEPGRCAAPNHLPVDCRVGLYYGFAELRFRFGRLVRLDLRPILGVGPQSFDGGAGAQLIVGHDPGTHVAMGIEGVSHIGVRGWLRLAWNTVPRVPMSFTIDGENFPNNDAFAMRLMMNFSYRFARHFSMDVMAGYATRGWQVGGPTVGGALLAEF